MGFQDEVRHNIESPLHVFDSFLLHFFSNWGVGKNENCQIMSQAEIQS